MENTIKRRFNAKMLVKMLQAKFLICVKGMNQKNTAENIGVTENTISSWVKTFGWVEAFEKVLRETRFCNSLHDFMVFAQNEYPQHYDHLQAMQTRYINGYNDMPKFNAISK